MNKIFYGDTQPNHKEHKIWIDSKGIIKTYNNGKDKWVALTNNSVPEEPEKPTSLYEFVDLGLPSGTLWATTNVGAEKPEDLGFYFAWGEIEGDEISKYPSWEDYKFGTEDALTKYNEVDGLTVLELEDDAAYQSDNSCKMPTKADVEELIANTTSTWEESDGLGGRRFISKTNGNSIFIPAEPKGGPIGWVGDFWTCSLNEDELV